MELRNAQYILSATCLENENVAWDLAVTVSTPAAGPIRGLVARAIAVQPKK